MNSNIKKRLLIPIYIILFSLLIGCINQPSSTKAPKFSAAELQQAEQIRNNLFTPGSVTIRGTIKGYNSKLGVKTYQLYYCNYFDDIHNSRISTDDYNALSGLFNFTAIPHHELITPDGRALTRVPEMLEVDPNNPDPNQK